MVGALPGAAPSPARGVPFLCLLASTVTVTGFDDHPIPTCMQWLFLNRSNYQDSRTDENNYGLPNLFPPAG